MKHNLTSLLLSKLSSAYSEEGLNNKAHLQVINHSEMNAKDESSLETLIIGFNSYENSPENATINAAEFIFDNAKEIIPQLLKEIFDNPRETSFYNNGNMLLWAIQDMQYITILCSDETIYITAQYAANF